MITLRDGKGNELQSDLTTHEAKQILQRVENPSQFVLSMARCRYPTETQLYYIHRLAQENRKHEQV